MNKKQKVELVTSIGVVITVILLVYIGLSNIKLFTDSPPTFFESILFIFFILAIILGYVELICMTKLKGQSIDV